LYDSFLDIEEGEMMLLDKWGAGAPGRGKLGGFRFLTVARGLIRRTGHVY